MDAVIAIPATALRHAFYQLIFSERYFAHQDKTWKNGHIDLERNQKKTRRKPLKLWMKKIYDITVDQNTNANM